MATANSKRTVVQKEAENESITFDYDGETYTVPPAKKWPLKVIRAQEENRVIACVEGLLGKEQMAKFEKKERTMGDLDDLMTALFDAADLDPKE